MFNEQDLSIIRRDFFRINILGDAIVEFQSQNGDWWILMEIQEWLSHRQMVAGAEHRVYYKMLHRHADADTYHEQGDYISVLDAVLEVIDHDDYRLKHRGWTHFDELLEEALKMPCIH